jgi:hypothetical protein
MSFNVGGAFQDGLTHSEQVNVIVASRNRFASTHGDKAAATTTDRGKLITAVTEQLVAEGADGKQATGVAEKIVDAWLHSSSMTGKKGDDKTLHFTASDIAFPVKAAPAGTGKGGALDGISGPGAIKAEDAVAKRKTDRSKPWTMDEIKANPSGFARMCPQIDGKKQTTADRMACGVAAYVQGMVRARPAAMKDFADRMLAPDGNLTLQGKRLFSGLDTVAGREALARIKAGTFSPVDVHTVMMGMYESISGGTKGTTPDDLISMRGRLTQLGVSVPRVEMELFAHETGGIGHWRSVVGSEQFDPWPNAKGESDVITDGTGLAKGTQDGKGWVNSKKLFLDDKQAVLNVYNLQVEGFPETTTKDPPLVVAGYHLTEGNTGWTRDSLSVEGLLAHLPPEKRPFAHPAAKQEVSSGVSMP